MSDFRIFLKQLAKVLQFTALAPDKHGACLVIMKKNNIPLLFEFDDHLVPNTILISTPIIEVALSHEWHFYNETLKGNSLGEETLSLKPDDNLIYLHRRLSPLISAEDLQDILDVFIAKTVQWKECFEKITQEREPDKPDEPPTLKPYRFKV
ncbi:MAG: type III secretion system chaperone [Chlamydiales bacterium]|nr:type III secretion system chaperone [Chlamydiales bacterium]